MPTTVSAIVISLEEGHHLAATIQELYRTLPAGAEILVVDDGSTDGSTDFLTRPGERARLLRSKGLGVAGARNLGAAETTGDVLVFVDAHMTLPDFWIEPLLEFLADHPLAAVAPGVSDVTLPHRTGFGLRLKAPDLTSEWLPGWGTEPREVAILPGCSLAMRRDAFNAAGGFDGGMIRSQGIDNEFCLRLWLLGFECWILPGTVVTHLFRERLPYPTSWEIVLHNRLRLAMRHLDSDRLRKACQHLAQQKALPGAMALFAESDALSERKELASRRVRTLDWFFEKFGPAW